MATCILVPIGVTKETVERILAKSDIDMVKCIIAVTVPGFEKIKEPIIRAIGYLADMLGARLHRILIEPEDPKGARLVLDLLLSERPSTVVFVGITGSRYLYPIITMSLLQYWRLTNAKILLQHGIEGEEPKLIPFPGFFAPAMRISGVQKKVLNIVYSINNTLSGKDLMEKYGFTKSVYAVLEDLERKGLLIVRRGRIERTFPGELLYNIIKE